MDQFDEQPRSSYEQMKLRVQRRDERVNDFKERQAEMALVKEAEEQEPTWTGETLKAVWGAGVDLVTESFILAKDVLDPDFFVQTLSPDLYEELHPGELEEKRAFNAMLREQADNLAPENETIAGSAARGILQFIVPYAGMSKTLGASKTLADATARGFVIDAGLFDPNEGNLSNLIEQLDPDTKDSVLTFLATDPDDSEALNRLRNGLEGMVLGTVLEGIFRMARHFKGTKEIDRAFEAADETVTPIDDIKVTEEVDAVEAKNIADELDAQAKAEQSPEEAVLSEAKLVDDLRGTLQLEPKQREALNEALQAGDDEAAASIINSDFNLDTFNWESIEEAADIKRLLNAVSESLADHIDEVKGGVQSHVQTKRLANLVGVTGEQVHKLFTDVRGDKGIAVRFHAAQRTLLASAKEVFRLRDIAKAAPGDTAKKAALWRQVELHAALQAEVKGAQTEIARALNGMKILKNDAVDGFREFDALQRSMGGTGKTGHSWERFMDDLLDAKDLESLNAKLREQTMAGRTRDVIVEWTINAMLSSPKTHIINFTSNVLNTFLYSGDRLVSGAARRLLAGDKVAFREAQIDLMRKFSSLDEAFKLARQAWRDGAPVSDKRQRLEFQTRKAIRSDGDGMFAKGINALGEVVRVPGRLLITGDEFFKTINRNAEMAVLAYREADKLATKQGFEFGTPDYEEFVNGAAAKLIDPTTQTPTARALRVQAIEKSRLVTFQESPLTGLGGDMERLINRNAFVKLIVAPFFRTPMNILRQGLVDRTPLGILVKETRETYKAAGASERAEIAARMTSGVAAMSGFWAFSGAGEGAEDKPFQIIGKVPYQSSEKANGVMDYSIRIGDNWYQFNRLDPLGMWLGMVADARMHADHSDDDEKTFAIMQGALAGFMNNVTNKTWAKSLADIFDMMQGLQTNEPAAVERAWAKFSSGQVTKVIPQLAKSVGMVVTEDDEKFAREAWTFMDGLSASLPVLNRDVPVRHDALGRPITYDNSAASLVNPFAISPNPTSPVEQELTRLAFDQRPMRKSLANGLIDLTAEEYSELTGLVGKVKVSRHGNLEATLDDLVTGDKYQGMSDALKVYTIKTYISAARRMAKVEFLKQPGRMKRFTDAQLEVQAELFN